MILFPLRSTLWICTVLTSAPSLDTVNGCELAQSERRHTNIRAPSSMVATAHIFALNPWNGHSTFSSKPLHIQQPHPGLRTRIAECLFPCALTVCTARHRALHTVSLEACLSAGIFAHAARKRGGHYVKLGGLPSSLILSYVDMSESVIFAYAVALRVQHIKSMIYDFRIGICYNNVSRDTLPMC